MHHDGHAEIEADDEEAQQYEGAQEQEVEDPACEVPHGSGHPGSMITSDDGHGSGLT
jgi:hypothetical protein